MIILNNIDELISSYDLFLIDLWGVIHDGENLYEGALAALSKLKAHKKTVVFLSNAPRRAEKAVAVLTRLGIPKDFYHSVVTSGEVLWHDMKKRPANNGYYYIGPDRDINLLDEFAINNDPTKCDAIVLTWFRNDNQDIADIDSELLKLVSHKKRMICANPDFYVTKIDGRRFRCAGLIAKRYEELGGLASYYGKPHSAIYQYAIGQFPHISKEKVLAIGDGAETDILGANKFGIASVFVLSGIFAEELGEMPSVENLLRFCEKYNITMKYVMNNFSG